MQATGKLHADDLLEGKLGRYEQGAAFSGAEVDKAESGYVLYGHLMESLANVPRSGRHVELAVLEVFRGYACGLQRGVAGRANVTGTHAPLIFKELARDSDDACEIVARVHSPAPKACRIVAYRMHLGRDDCREQWRQSNTRAFFR